MKNAGQFAEGDFSEPPPRRVDQLPDCYDHNDQEREDHMTKVSGAHAHDFTDLCVPKTLNPDVMVMKSAKGGMRFDASCRLDRARIHGELLKLGFKVAQSSVAKYMVKRRGPPSQGWKTFCETTFRTLPPWICSWSQAFPWDEAPRYMIRDRDQIYGAIVTRRLRAMGSPECRWPSEG
jgi:hypothetical protein